MSTQEANPTNATSHNSVEGNSEVNASQNPTNDNQSERQVFPIEDTSPILPLSLGHPPNSPSSMPPPLYSSTAAHTTPLPQPQIQIQIPPNLDLPLPPSTSTTTTTTTTNTSAPQLPLPSITATNPPPNTTNLPSPVKSDPDPIAVMATDSKTSLPAFSYDDLETQFWKKVEEMEKKEGELRQEFEAWVEIFKAWGTSGARVDGERGAKRWVFFVAFLLVVEGGFLWLTKGAVLGLRLVEGQGKVLIPVVTVQAPNPHGLCAKSGEQGGG
ncbi:uncharacterized protein KY384_008542 [Bacidia gigantensis]|uniref:uncharacterized protein n=1 Tax=Bacidia gigantensis TaxID=2732470 RepID=UPI001D03898A|nr:uncharacterized protein KY384_008542 [Bacidia gigantensis]KAG8527113.1 hypothetical protein KY384_008542 [Bacidia gigantensis]